MHLGSVVAVEEQPESKGRSRTLLIAVSVGVVVVGVLVAFAFSRSNDERTPGTTPPATIGVIQAPAAVVTTVAAGGTPTGSAPITADVPVVPTGTADIPFPPVSSNILVP